jgi:hypothetical protein
MKTIAWAAACVALAACGSDDTGGPKNPASKSAADLILDVGTWYEPAYYTGDQAITGCGDACHEVIVYRFVRDPELTLFLDIYEDQAIEGYEAGALRCSESYRLTPIETAVDGRAVWEHSLLQDADCFTQPSLFIQSYQIVTSDGGKPTLVANWTVKKPDDAFQGYAKDGGKGFAIVPCPASAHAPGRSYCAPTCVIGSSEGPACDFPSP